MNLVLVPTWGNSVFLLVFSSLSSPLRGLVRQCEGDFIFFLLQQRLNQGGWALFVHQGGTCWHGQAPRWQGQPPLPDAAPICHQSVVSPCVLLPRGHLVSVPALSFSQCSPHSMLLGFVFVHKIAHFSLWKCELHWAGPIMHSVDFTTPGRCHPDGTALRIPPGLLRHLTPWP